MSKETNGINPYLVLGKLKELDVDYEKIKEFVNSYMVLAQRKGEEADAILFSIKQFSTKLNDAILMACVDFQVELPLKTLYSDPTNERMSVKKAAKTLAVTPATIRNWINDKSNPLPSLNSGKRKTTLSVNDVVAYMKKVNLK